MTNLFLKDPRMVTVIGIVGLIGYITDSILFSVSEGLNYLNVACIVLTFFALTFHLLKKPKVEVSLSGFAVILMANLLIAPFLQLSEPDFSSFYMRNSLIFWVIMPLLGLTIHKKMFLFSAVLYLVQFGVILNLSDNKFLSDSAVTIFLVLVGYIYVIMYLLRSLEDSASKTENLIESLRDKNIELNKKKEQLDSLVKTKDKLFSILAHDLQSPFMGIAGLSEMIKNLAEKGETNNVVEYSKMITDTTVRTNTLFSNLLDWAASQTGELRMEPETGSLNEYINETIELLQDHQNKKHIEIERVNTDISIFADPNGLKTILRNLLSNALKFTPENGSIKITAVKYDDETVVSISDNGIGIQKNNLSKLFDSDRFISTEGTNHEQGTGLGLRLCKEMIDHHGGQIWVESKPKEETIFHFSLPNEEVVIKH